jgi:hypothetical protein
MMDNPNNHNELSRPLNQAKEDKKPGLSPIKATDWTKTIGKIMVSKDGLDMGKIVSDGEIDYNTSNSITIEYGDRERFSIPKHTIYKFDQMNAYTSLTENEILAIKDADPFLSSFRSYTRD